MNFLLLNSIWLQIIPMGIEIMNSTWFQELVYYANSLWYKLNGSLKKFTQYKVFSQHIYIVASCLFKVTLLPYSQTAQGQPLPFSSISSITHTVNQTIKIINEPSLDGSILINPVYQAAADMHTHVRGGRTEQSRYSHLLESHITWHSSNIYKYTCVYTAGIMCYDQLYQQAEGFSLWHTCIFSWICFQEVF